MSKLILVVDDEDTIRSLIRDFLQDKDCRVLEAREGVSAFHLAEKEKPHLIIMDIMMPGMSGATAIKMLGDFPATSDIPVIVLSGADEDVVQDNLPAKPHIRFMRKPVELTVLWDWIREMIPQGGAA